MKTAIVTGATGFLGRHVVEQLCTTNEWHVVALHRKNSNLSSLHVYDIEFTEVSIDNINSLTTAIAPNTDCIFHVAANTTPWRRRAEEQFQDNVIGTRNIVSAALSKHVRRMVHVSSQSAFSHTHGTIDESAPQLGKQSWIQYNRTKALAEDEVRKGIERGLNAVIINPAHIMGRYARDSWARMIRMINDGSLPGVPNGAGSFCDAEQVAKAIITASEHGACGENFLLGGIDATFLEVAQIIGKLLSKKVPSKPLPTWILRIVAHIKNSLSYITNKEPDITPEVVEHVTNRYFVNCDKAKRELGYQVTPLEVILADSVNWLRSEKLI